VAVAKVMCIPFNGQVRLFSATLAPPLLAVFAGSRHFEMRPTGLRIFLLAAMRGGQSSSSSDDRRRAPRSRTEQDVARSPALKEFARAELRDGDPRAVIPEVAPDNGADVVVVGARGSGGFHGLGLGRVAHHLAHHLLMPVVIVPGSGGPLPGRPVVVATLDWAGRFVRHPQGATRADQKEELVRAQVALAVTPRVESAMTVEIDHPVTALTRAADEVNGSVIVVGRKGASHLRGMLLGRVPAQAPYHAHRPIAIIPRGAAD
jgi:nucleotide-binding universal stress UspA family protein